MKTKKDNPVNKEVAPKTSAGNSADAVKSAISPFLFSLMVTGAFAIVLLFGMVHHEMWRDELQAWMVAREAHSLGGLLDNLKYEGNPILWHFFLYLLTRFTHDPVYMQALHFIFACSFIYVFTRYATLGRLYKVMFSFGYMTLYEYSVISRCYGLALLLIFIVCALYKDRHSRYLLLGIMLALLANVTTYGIIIASGFAGILAIDYLFFPATGKKDQKGLIAGLAIAVIGIVLSVCQVLPEKDNTFPRAFADSIGDVFRWGSVLSKIFIAWFYIPKLDGIDFWNNNCYTGNVPDVQYPLSDWLFSHTQYLFFWYIFPIAVFILSLLIFLRKPLVFLLYATIMTGLIAFYYYTGLLFYRYCSFMLVILIASYWLENYYPEHEYRNAALSRLSGFGRKIQKPFLAAVLAVNIIGATVAYAKDYTYEFSASKAAATYIHENKLDKLTIAGAPFYVVSPLAGWLDTRVFYFQTNSFGTYCLYKGQINWGMTVPDMHNSIAAIMRDGRKEMLVVAGEPWTITRDGGAHFEPVESGPLPEGLKFNQLKFFEAGIVPDEQYYLYLIHR